MSGGGYYHIIYLLPISAISITFCPALSSSLLMLIYKIRPEITKCDALNYYSEKCLMILHRKYHGVKQMDIRFNLTLKKKKTLLPQKRPYKLLRIVKVDRKILLSKENMGGEKN